MELVKLDRSGSCTDHMSIEQLGGSDACPNSGEREILPRIDDKYQVEIPPLLGQSDYALYKRNPLGLSNEAGCPSKFLVGLPILVTEINTEVGPINRDSATFLGDSGKSSDKSANLRSQVSQRKYFCRKNKELETNVNPCDIPAYNGTTFPAPEVEENEKQCMSSHYHLVPGSDVDPWSAHERGSFLLGLYIFGKDFVRVKKFVEKKTMGDILLLYYGGFYGSQEYQRWSECRKGQSNECVDGEKIFNRRRQQELLSRLLPSVSNECQKSLLKVSNKFRARRMEFVEYVFTLKAIVGVNVLVEAVGLGKEKKDLTSVTLDSSLTNQVNPLRVEVLAGKAWTNLEPSEIIQFLTGGYRLSKARASHLFWEAVWPRLLARGWQSEQPKGEGRDSLVFLVPGIKKFSRKRLEKGKHYFVSTTDILSKVASEPALIDLDSGNDDDNVEKEEDLGTSETEEEQDGITKRKRRRYLQPQTTFRKRSGVKFSVVDTSLPHERPYELKELGDLLREVTSKAPPSDVCEDRDESSPELSSNESETDNAMLADGKLLEMPSTETDHVAPTSKRLRMLIGCSQRTMNLKTESPSSCSGNNEFENVDLSSQASSQGKASSTTTSQDCDMECVERTPSSDVHVMDHSNQNGQKGVTDLNVPVVSPDNGRSRVFMTKLADMDAHTHQKPEAYNMDKIINDVDGTGQQHELVQRRHGTRNRPPTAKALEALANGLLTVNKKPRKKRLTVSREIAQRGGGASEVTDLSSCSIEYKIAENASKSDISYGSNVVKNFQVLPEENGPATGGP